MFGHRGVHRVPETALLHLLRAAFRSLTLILALAIVASCSQSSSSGSGGGGSTSGGEGEGTITVSKGGNVRSLDGRFLVTIPAGESSATVKITVTIATNQVPTAALKSLVGDAYEVTVTEGSMASSATIELEYEPSRVNAPAGTPVSSLVSLARLSGESWQPVDGATVDSANNLITASVSSFSIFGVIQKTPTVPPSTGGGGGGGSGGGSTLPPDTTPPDTLIGSSPLLVTTTKTASFVLASSEKDSTFECKLDNESFAPCSTPKEYSALTDGTHQFQVKAKDKAGNVDPTPFSFSWTIDTIAPTAPDAAKMTVTDNPVPTIDKLSGSASAVSSDAATIRIYKDSTLGTLLADEAVKNDGSFDPVSIGSDQRDGNALIYVVAFDAAGNQSSATSVLADRIGVECLINSAPTATLINQNATFTFSANSTETGVQFKCKVDSGAFATCSSPYTTPNPTQLGTHTFEVQAADKYGNSGVTLSRTWTLGAQSVTITASPALITLNLKGTLTFTASPAGTGVTFYCKVDAGTTAYCTSPYNVNLAMGSHTFQVQAYDQFSIAGETKTYTWEIKPGIPAIDNIGQATGSSPLYTRGSNGGLDKPEYVAVDRTNYRLFVSDTLNNRVLVYPLSASFQMVSRYPDYVLGQLHHEANSATVPSAGDPTASQRGFSQPRGLAVYDNKLFVADSLNNRILVFDVRSAGSSNLTLCGTTTTGLADGMAASCVFGQAGFLTSTGGLTQSTLSSPTGLATHSSKPELFVADSLNNRTLVFDIRPSGSINYDPCATGTPTTGIANGIPASCVLGQPNFTTLTVATPADLKELRNPVAVAYYHHASDDSQRYLAIADQLNHRILIHNRAAGFGNWINYQSAAFVLGQGDFSGNTPGVNAGQMSAPSGVAWNEDASRLYVSDTGNLRLQVFDLGNGLSSGEAEKVAVVPTGADAFSFPVSLTPDLNGVHFIDNNNGWAVGDSGTVIRTTNGGTSWTTQSSNVSYDLLSVHFTSATSGYAVGVSGTVISTTDAGSTWTVRSSGVSTSLNGVHFPVSAATGYAVGDAGVIRKTVDSGATWSTSPSGVTTTLYGVYFVDDLTGYVVGANGKILKTTTGGTGATPWTDISGSPTPYTTNALYSVHFPVNAATGYVVGAVGTVLMTLNSGTTFVAQVPGTTANLYSVRFAPADNNNGYAVGSGGAIYRTSNGGTAWTGQVSGTTGPLTGVSAPVSATTAFTSAPVGQVFKTTDGASWNVLTAPYQATGVGLAFSENAYGRLYIADKGNHRIQLFTVFPTDPEDISVAFDMIGHLDGSGNANRAIKTRDNPSPTSFFSPYSAGVDDVNKRFYVTDTKLNRLLAFSLNSDMTLTDRSADNVLGQADLYSAAPAVAQRNALAGPSEAVYDKKTNRLFVVDTDNSRVLVFDVASLANQMNASFVLGQVNYITSQINCTQSGMNKPAGIALDSDGNRLYVADTGHHRILAFDTSALSDGMLAVKVLGQLDFITCANPNWEKATVTNCGDGVGPPYATNACGLSSPKGLTYDTLTNRLFAADSGNHRVVAFNVGAGGQFGDGMAASFVLGQTSFSGFASGTTQTTLNGPMGLTFDKIFNRLFIADTGNNRIVIADLDVLGSSTTFINVVGQTNFTANSPQTTQTGLRGPKGIMYEPTSGRLYVVDNQNNRFLIFDAK